MDSKWIPSHLHGNGSPILKVLNDFESQQKLNRKLLVCGKCSSLCDSLLDRSSELLPTFADKSTMLIRH